MSPIFQTPEAGDVPDYHRRGRCPAPYPGGPSPNGSKHSGSRPGGGCQPDGPGVDRVGGDWRLGVEGPTEGATGP